MKNKSYGFRVYRKNTQEYGDTGLLEIIRCTRQDIDRHYTKPFDADNLLKRWSRLEFHAHEHTAAWLPLAVSYVVGFLTAFYFFLMSLPQVSGSLGILLGATLLFLVLFLGGILLAARQTGASYEDPYRNYILPYEKQVLARKLETEFGFSPDGHPQDSMSFDLEPAALYDDLNDRNSRYELPEEELCR